MNNQKRYPDDIPSAVGTKLFALYGSSPPTEITGRLKKELAAMTRDNYEMLSSVAEGLAAQSRQDGLPVRAKGTIGSCFTAFLLGITGVNPLRPNCYCKHCKYVKFADGAASGFDLADKGCPECGKGMTGDGHDIPFESFCGLHGEKASRAFSYETLYTLHRFAIKSGTAIDDIPMNDWRVYKAFSDGDTLTIPEFDSEFMINILTMCRPKCFSDMVKIYGLSHSSGGWTDNAEILLHDGTAALEETIALRDDILNLLVSKGFNKAYEITEIVRKGRGNELPRDLFDSYGLPDWYMESCKKIKYLHPKSHAVSRVKTAVQMMWFKIYHPEIY